MLKVSWGKRAFRIFVRQWRLICSLCNGTGKIVRESSIATFGNDTQVYCSVCGRSYFRSTGHSHVTCPTCHGKGYVEYRL